MMNKHCNCACVYKYAVNIEVFMIMIYLIYTLDQYFYNPLKIYHHSEKQCKQEQQKTFKMKMKENVGISKPKKHATKLR